MKPSYIFSSLAFIVITIIGLLGVFEHLPQQAIGVTIVANTLAVLLLVNFIPQFNAEVQAISTENLILLHTIRAPIGAGFLIFYKHGMLPEAFALRAGWGDIVAAGLGVLVVLLSTQFRSQIIRNRLYLLWSVVGLADLLIAVGTGLSLGLADEASMVWITRLPLLLVPTCILPVLFSTHLIILKRILPTQTERMTG